MRKFLLIVFILLISLLSFAFDGYVVKVADGDSFVIKSYGQKIRVRMYGIDAPELKQQYGKEAKKHLENLILGKRVELDILYEDRYSRKIARVYYKDKEINLEMLRSGNAWFYEYHAKKEKEYRRAYEKARKEKIGLWRDKNPQNPREFRLKNKRG